MLIFAGVIIDGSSNLQRAFFRCYNDLWIYHAHESYWEPSKTVGAEAGEGGGQVPSLPPKRGSHSAVLLEVQGRDVMLVYAGFGCADTFQVRKDKKDRWMTQESFFVYYTCMRARAVESRTSPALRRL
jgi:hypothetical protein